MSFLKVENLSVSVDEKPIVKNLDLEIKSGSIHALMGPNGSGKSTLAKTLMGHYDCQVEGKIIFQNKDISDLSPEKRSKLGFFMSFQNPLEIPGLQVLTFLKELHSIHNGTISVLEFKVLVKEYLKILNLDEAFLFRNLNDGFSGGEKKRLEMLQLMVVQPKLAIIDEIDSGLDVDALKKVADAIKFCRLKNPKMAVILITHYNRILDHIQPDYVHVLTNGSIKDSSNFLLAKVIEKTGYSNYGQL